MKVPVVPPDRIFALHDPTHDQISGIRQRHIDAHLQLRRLLERAQFLLPQDRTLLELVVGKGSPIRHVALACGIPAGTVTRRLRRLANRLSDPLVIALLDDKCPLRRDVRQLGIEHFVQACRTRDLAEYHRMSPEQVRKMIAYIRGWHRGKND